jgi:nucleoside-diphosphate-sugar epimerase
MVCAEAGTVPRLRTAPRWVMNTLGFFNPQMREVAEMIYEFEEPFVLDHSRFANTFGDHSTPLPEAIRRTVEWYRGRSTKIK